MSTSGHLGDLVRITGRLGTDVDTDAVARLLQADAAEAAFQMGPREEPFERVPSLQVQLPPATSAEERTKTLTNSRRRPTLSWWRELAELFGPNQSTRRWFAVVSLALVMSWLPQVLPSDAWYTQALSVIIGLGVVVGLVGLAFVVVKLIADYAQRWRKSTLRNSTATWWERKPATDAAGSAESFTDWSDGGAEAVHRRPPPVDLLVPKGVARAVVSALVAIPTPVGLSVEDWVQARARRSPARSSTSARRRWRTASSVDLHVDRSQAIEPFSADVSHIERLLQGVVGTHSLRTFDFVRDPNRVLDPHDDGSGDPWMSFADTTPRPATPVIVVTDLGVARPRSGTLAVIPDRFIEHAARARNARTTATYVTFYPADRRPPSLRRLAVVYWHRRLTVAAPRRVRERSHLG